MESMPLRNRAPSGQPPSSILSYVANLFHHSDSCHPSAVPSSLSITAKITYWSAAKFRPIAAVKFHFHSLALERRFEKAPMLVGWTPVGYWGQNDNVSPSFGH